MRVLLIDNYDSFSYNLVQYFKELGCEAKVLRNDDLELEEIAALSPDRIVISPGPGMPADAGVCCHVVKEWAGQIPILGVCLGHQVIGEVYGATVGRAKELRHGKTSLIYHDSDTIFTGLPNPFTATRYHSLVVYERSFPDDLLVNAWTQDRVIMGLRHQKFPVFGVQFHPESILTTLGKKILENFLSLADLNLSSDSAAVFQESRKC